MRAFVLVCCALSLSLVACGGKGAPPTANTGGTGGTGGTDAFPWEAALTEGATFTLAAEFPSDDGAAAAPVTVTVDDVTTAGTARTYHLTWSDGPGPDSVTVDGAAVVIGAATSAAMKPPLTEPGSDEICYGEDFSVPDECPDVCDADLCLSPRGIVAVDGLYAPNHDAYRAK